MVGLWVSEWSRCTAGTARTTCKTCTSVTCVCRSSASGGSPPPTAVHRAVQLWRGGEELQVDLVRLVAGTAMVNHGRFVLTEEKKTEMEEGGGTKESTKVIRKAIGANFVQYVADREAMWCGDSSQAPNWWTPPEGLGAPRREDEVEEPLPPAAPPERRLEPIAAVETLRMTSSRPSTRAVCGRQELARSQGCNLAGRGIREAWRSR